MATEENDFPTLLKSFMIITLFSFIILSIVILFAGEYGKDTTEIGERIGLNVINATLSNIESTTKGWQTDFNANEEKESSFQIILDVLGFLSIGMFNILKGMITFIVTPFTIFSNILSNVLGVPTIVVSIINALIILTGIFGLWSLLKRGI